MMAAVIASVGLMMVASGPIGDFVSRHPTVKMLALSFLLVIGVVLMADAFGHHVPKGYIYSAMAFSVMVEMLNLRMRSRAAAPGRAGQAPRALRAREASSDAGAFGRSRRISCSTAVESRRPRLRRPPAHPQQLRKPGLSGGHRRWRTADRQVLPPGPLER